MQIAKPVGRNASALKYDILSALSAHALAGDKNRQRLVLRISLLITARYNWQRNELSIGREEISRLWSVDERTVKREMSRLRSMGWLTVKRPGARGRVSVYELDLKQMLVDTRPSWHVLGADFTDRIDQEPRTESNVVPFQANVAAPPDGTEDTWSLVQAALHARDPELWSSWFRHLSEAERAGGRATLMAPSRFMADYIASQWTGRLLAAYARVDPSVRSIRIESAV
ncbi:DnaA N-terminal domain-containing protein [Ruegeria marina]|uniref:DnaA N-terminal domain-containing protein n=2 Tax=Ruegeria marina TaxID=639004 RepID=A0A1G7CV17_9RHOB|nr:DnaA N-terminal domain-containing protein [Ruegeria marina]SDE42345.1 DnaA N-terminal domain-containing protein [Ruegeria marina]